MKYEGSLSTQINFADTSSSSHVAKEGKESGKKERFCKYMALAVCDQHQTTIVCWLPKMTKQSKKSRFITAQVTKVVSKFKGRQVLPHIHFKHTDAENRL